MGILKGLKKFFTPYKWETVIHFQIMGYRTLLCFRSEIPLSVILQIDKYKKTYRCFATDGSLKKDVSLSWVLDYSNKSVEIKEVLNKFDIKY